MAPEQELALMRQDYENTLRTKNNQIIELEHTLHRADIRIKTLEQKLNFEQDERKALSQKYNELQLYSRERAHANTQKNIRIASLEQEIEKVGVSKEKNMQIQMDKLLQVIRSQEQQLSTYLNDHRNYVQEFERVSLSYRHLQAESKLVNQYNSELEKQIGEVETHNNSLESWVANAHGELSAQNEQAGDLLSQVEYMMEGSAVSG